MEEYYGRGFIPYDAGSYHPGFDDEQHPLMRAFYLILLFGFAIFILATVYYRDNGSKENRNTTVTMPQDRRISLHLQNKNGSLYPKHSTKVKPSVRRRSTVVELPRYKRRMMKENAATKKNTLQVPNLIRVSERPNRRRRVDEQSKAVVDAGKAPESHESIKSITLPHRDSKDMSSLHILWTDRAEPDPVPETESTSATKGSGLDDVTTESDVENDGAVDLPSTLKPEPLIESIGPSTKKEKGQEEVSDQRNNEILAPKPEETIEPTVGTVDEQKDNAGTTSDSESIDSTIVELTDNMAAPEPNIDWKSNEIVESTPLEPFPNLVEPDTCVRRSTPAYRSARIAKFLGRDFNSPGVQLAEDVRHTARESEDSRPSGNVGGKDEDDPFTDLNPTDMADNLFSSLQKKPAKLNNAIPEAGIETKEESPLSSSAMDKTRGTAGSRESRDLDSSPTRSRHRKGPSHSSQLADALLKRSRVPKALKTPDWNPVAAQNSEDSRPTSPKTRAARRKSSYSHVFSEEPGNPWTPRRSSYAPPIQEEPTSPFHIRTPRNSAYTMISSDEVPINSPSASAISLPWTLRKMSITNGSRPQTPIGTQSRRASERWEIQPGRRASVNVVQPRVLESLPSSPREIFQGTTSVASPSDLPEHPSLPSSSLRGSAALGDGLEDSQENPPSGQEGDISPRPPVARRQTETSSLVVESTDEIERPKDSGR